jgi:hypothetical protein
MLPLPIPVKGGSLKEPLRRFLAVLALLRRFLRAPRTARLAELLSHVGHSSDGEALLGAQAETVENTAWNLVQKGLDRLGKAELVIPTARSEPSGEQAQHCARRPGPGVPPERLQEG